MRIYSLFETLSLVSVNKWQRIIPRRCSHPHKFCIKTILLAEGRNYHSKSLPFASFYSFISTITKILLFSDQNAIEIIHDLVPKMVEICVEHRGVLCDVYDAPEGWL